jgi:hypothetical protein
MTVFLKNLDLSKLSKKSKRVSANAPRVQSLPFPLKLHRMLSEAEEQGNEHIVSWLPDGRSFLVHNPEKFVEIVLPSHFKQVCCSKAIGMICNSDDVKLMFFLPSSPFQADQVQVVPETIKLLQLHTSHHWTTRRIVQPPTLCQGKRRTQQGNQEAPEPPRRRQAL